MLASRLKAQDSSCSSSSPKVVRWRILSCLGETDLSVLPRPSNDCIRAIHIMEDNLLYSGFTYLNDSLSQKHPTSQNIKLIITVQEYYETQSLLRHREYFLPALNYRMTISGDFWRVIRYQRLANKSDSCHFERC